MLPSLYSKQDINNRKHQINTLKIFNDNVIDIICDKEYEIPFETSSHKLTLKISLTDDFPKQKPVLTIQPPIIHPWVNESGNIIAAPGLVNFTVHSDLGRVVQVIIREFKRNPPRFAPTNTTHVGSPNVPIPHSRERTNSASYHKSYSLSPSPPSSPASVAPPPPPLPPQTASIMDKSISYSIIPELNNLTIEELRLLNDNDDCQIEFINEMADIKDLNIMFDEMITANEELAKANLQKQEALEKLRSSVDYKIEEVTKLAFNNERLFAIYQNLSERFSPRKIQEELGKAVRSAEESSEKFAEDFLQGQLDIETFLNTFIKAKTSYQLRKTKEEKLNQQLNKLEKAGF